ncbi:MAG: RdgB/HAM1 family non-canonical purine NTP pyrophosphatase [Chitinophagaceae bacterium]|nr:RdgB/HAM1 family non-canonical purine NTP pyrophosphatase [Chitinophagaceae bacterium]MCA6446758.1 RdgB/HAM1 family non-canonical purine NTP pyrophosphatase [Chitinophagaceae bacterium]
MQLIFATNNTNKVIEIQSVIPAGIQVVSLAEAGINIDIPEPHHTLEANATEKSTVIHQLTHKNCFSEDTGLEVAALNGEPGVKSARYAGDNKSFTANIDKLLSNLLGEKNRRAQFRTVISLIWNNKEYQFEGICKGQITHETIGTNGFGYDAVFIPDGSDKTFGEMSLQEKNAYSHRKKAVTQLISCLQALTAN